MKISFFFVFLVMVSSGIPSARADDVDLAIDRGVRFLLEIQEIDGSWKGPHPDDFPSGMTAMAVYTLLKCGLAPDHPAVRKGLAFMASKTCDKTYGAGANLLAYQALGEGLPKKRVAALTQFLIESMFEAGEWGYPRTAANPADLSNTQYALLGLRAAAQLGQKVPLDIWRKAAELTIDRQLDYGEWKYRENWENATSSMTVAGTTCLLMCREQLADSRRDRTLVKKIDAHIERAMAWLKQHWTLEKNVALPEPKATTATDRWFFYYLYGVERLGAMTEKEIIAEHHWHVEGAKVLLEKQAKNGAWGTAYGERDANTCFALLFLRRGSRSTGLSARVRAQRAADEKAPFQIATDGNNPALVWVRGHGAAVNKRLDEAQEVSGIEWRVNGQVMAQLVPKKVGPGEREFLFEHPFEANGHHEIEAVLYFRHLDTGRNVGQEKSNTLVIEIDDIWRPKDDVIVADLGKNLIDGREVAVTASSVFDDARNEAKVTDGTYTTSWLAAAADAEPWIQVRFERGVTARTLKFGSAHPYAADKADWDRPREIEVLINGSERSMHTLPDTVDEKHVVTFNRRRIHKIRVRIRSRYEGKNPKHPVGLKEIELFK